MKFNIKVLFYLSYGFCFAQSKSFVVVDSISKNPIELVSIKLLNTNSGTFTNYNGIAEIDKDVFEVEFFCLGYESKKLRVDKIKDTVFLKSVVSQLDEVQIIKLDKRTRFNYKKTKSKIKFSTNTQGFMFSKKIDIDEECYLLSIDADVLNDEVEKKVILSLYSVGEDDKPKSNIYDRHLYSSVKPNDEKLIINFSENPFYLSKGKYFIVLTILSAEENKDSSIKFGITQDKSYCSFLKPYFNEKIKWQTLPSIKQRKFYNLNIGYEIGRL